ncbi:PREDICTED: heavy metal-associated isoprenylated plant protein 2-like [Ipomoea nil]|uniref:heavy metal-associated isoprenylated plant protein 2-like n=1 Tax=Ipomoea nil TaxID=35883 RepID=UPI000901414C|nr:PREDICTED: heavy metal-associated isoprenylated plant protein 2-like [Ipomoea nil]
MVQKTVLKVDISCEKCKKKLLKAVSGVEGVDKIEIDEAKGSLSVTGSCDPYEIIVKIKKTGKFMEVVSIGPPPAPPKQDAPKKAGEKKPEGKKAEEKKNGDEQIYPGYIYFPPPPLYYPPLEHVTQPQDSTPLCNIL